MWNWEGILVYSDQPTKKLALVFELMEMNIYELIRGRRNYVSEDRIKSYMYQLMKGDPSSWHHNPYKLQKIKNKLGKMIPHVSQVV
jgi:hypothetical protein